MLTHAAKLLASIRGVPCYNIGQHVEYAQNFRVFPQSLQANADTVSQMRPVPLPSTSFRLIIL